MMRQILLGRAMRALVLVCFVFLTSLNAKDVVHRKLPEAAISNMNRQRSFVVSLCAKHKLGRSVTGTKADYDLIELILKKRLIRKGEAWELQSLGVVFGDALVAEEPRLRWMEVTDAWGTDPALIYADTTYQLNAVTMIQKRVEDGEAQPFVHSLAETLLRLARESAKSAK